MRHKKIIARAIWFAVCLSVLLAAPLLIAANTGGNQPNNVTMNVLTVWQIDSFEGGKGSRASYLQNLGDKFSQTTNCYVKVISVTSGSARQNLNSGVIPDLVSYGAGMYGLESYITDKTAAHVWAHGGYCILTIDESADFSDISGQNTVINIGLENYSQAAALMCGVGEATKEKPTAAYVSLLNGKYKYLLGTQRDIFRLKTRNAAFKVKPLTEFNDLYQLISVTSKTQINAYLANKFINFVQSNSAELTKIGLMGDSKLYQDEMSQMENISYEYTLTSPMGKEAKSAIDAAIKNSNMKLLKNLLK